MKRFLYITGVFCFSLLLVLSMLVAVLMSDRVQTAAVQWVTAEFAEAFGTKAHVGAVEYHFPARVSVRDVYIEDLQHDTLLHIDEMYLHYKPLALIQNEIKFSHVRVSDAVIKVYKHEDEWNYQFLVDGFKKDEEKESEPMKSLLSVRDIQLDNIRVQYEDYVVFLPHATMDVNKLTSKTLDAEISKFAMRVTRPWDEVPPQPFVVNELQAHMLLSDSTLSLPTLKAELPCSRIDVSGVEVHYPAEDSLSAEQTAERTRFALHFHEATLVPAEISLFVPRVKGLTHPITLNGAVGGRLDSVYFDDIEVQYDGHSFLTGDVCAVGLPDIGNAYLRANVKDIHTNAARFQDFLSQLNGRPTVLPQPIHRLGEVHYSGTMEGTMHDMTLHGAFRTALGSITTDGSFICDSTYKHMLIDARIVGRKFRLGRLIDQPKLESVTLDFYGKGEIDEGEARGELDVRLKQLTYNNYTYNDLHLNGHYEPQLFKGRCTMDDPHMKMRFDGVVNLRQEDPVVDFKLSCFHFDNSPFTEDHKPTMKTSFALAVDMKGAKVDEISGDLNIDSLFVGTALDSVLVKQIQLKASATPDRSKAITLRSDNIDAQLDGKFRYEDIVPAGQALLHYYLPSIVDEPLRAWQPVKLSMRANSQRLRAVQRLFEASVTISDHTTFSLDASLRKGKKPSIAMRFYAPGVRANETPIHDLTITLNTVDTLKTQTKHGLVLAASAEVNGTYANFSTAAYRDSLLTHIAFSHQAAEEETTDAEWKTLTYKERLAKMMAAQRAGYYGGELDFETAFSKYKKKPLIKLHFQPAELVLRDSLYTLSESRMTYTAAETSLQIEHFAFEGAGQHIRANGTGSPKATDTLSVAMQRLDASYIVPFVLPKQIIMFNGLLTGQADITGLLGKPRVDSRIHVDSMGLNDCYFGDAEVDLYVHPEQLQFHADVYQPTTQKTVVDLNGEARFDRSGHWKLDMQVDSVPLQFINHWTHAVMKDLDGYGTGHVAVGNVPNTKSTYVVLQALAENASLTLPWTNVRYTIPHDTILMDTTVIRFPNVHLVDAYGNPVELKGDIRHKDFTNFHLDLHVDTHEALVFDSNEPGEMLQGSVYADGHVDVTGNEDDILVSAEANTSKNSRFRLSIDNASSAGESSFIHFVEHPEADTTAVEEHDWDNIDTKRVVRATDNLFKRASRCLLKLNLDVNKLLDFQLVLGERNGDMIESHGNGALSLTYDTQTDDVSLLGTYQIEQGSLTYTVANVIHKTFTVGEGSTIVFSGDASNPQLDVTAKYRVTASLRDLFGEESDQIAMSRSSIPVNTCLHLTGLLNNPILNFGLEFPSSDQTVQQQIKQVINTDEMLMRQVIYLLVFGRFFTPDYMTNAQMATLNSTYSLLSSTVTGQINSWLSKLTNMLTVGVAIRTDGEGAESSQEYEAQFQLQPVDRLLINGNVGYRYNDISNQPFFGDLDVEVMLTEDGQIRLKGYTHMVDKYSLRQASTIQGVGFMWKKDF